MIKSEFALLDLFSRSVKTTSLLEIALMPGATTLHQRTEMLTSLTIWLQKWT